ncbi:alpha-L-fucosidase [Arthrobacter sp. 35W]|uniref:alpha-L-fucosidase n=1 Tax=Arthrobacter sp. 35W TaxID=1132441 RepID=UPI00041A3878|nr:alpha-L-fucosidase [Arthrobacter sp. 35W]
MNSRTARHRVHQDPPIRRRRRAGGRTLRGLALLSAASLFTSLLAPALSAQAAPADSLNVGFNGSLVGTTAYTTTEGESMHGVLRRVNGNETQVPGKGVQLAGGTAGIRYVPTDLSTGTDTADRGFLGEVKFTPLGSDSMSTLFSAGGNFYIRAQGGKLRYGFDSLAGSTWSSHKEEVDYPTLGKEHALSFHYLPSASGVALNVWLDGVALPVVASPAPAKNATNLGSTFGFGQEVNSQAADRGFTGLLHQVRLAAATAAFAPSDFEFQPRPASTTLMDVSYDGTFTAGAYAATGTDVLLGSLRTRAGTEAIVGGKATLAGGTQGLGFTSTDVSLGTTVLDKGFVAEAVFTPTTGQAAQGTLIAVGGNFFVRYTVDGSSLEYGYSTNASGSWVDYKASVPAPATGAAHTVSIAYVPGTTGKATLAAALDGRELAPVEGTGLSTRNGSVTQTASFGNDLVGAAASRGFKGSLDKTRFAMLVDGYKPAAFAYQEIVPTEPETCEPLLVDPANYISVSTGDCTENIIAKASMVRPTPAQLQWQEARQTAFLHFGINTFYDQEWGHGTEDPARFNPTDFDADSWVKTLRDNGFRYAVLTVKHHDGFMSYPSRYTDYTVQSSPWRNGKGDVVKEFTDAAHKYGMKVGLYMSPADSNQEVDGVFGNGSAKSLRTIPTLVPNDDRAGKDLPQFHYQATDYGSFFLNTLYEILTQYGQVDEVWFDGAQGNTAKQEIYDYPAFYDMIAKLQPNALVAVGGNDVRWIGNEEGVARPNEWGVLPIRQPTDGGKINGLNPDSNDNLGSRNSLVNAVKSGAANSLHWWPGEADMKLTQGWFAHPNDSPKSPTAMLTKYHESAGRNAILLLNVPPTTTGRFAPSSVAALQGFTAERQKAFTEDYALGLPATVDGESTPLLTDGNFRTGAAQGLANGGVVQFDLGSAKTVSRIALSEDVLNHGQNVEKFTVEAKVNGTWSKVAEAGTIGVLRIQPFTAPVTAQEFRVTVVATRTPAFLANASLYGTLSAAPAPVMDLYVDCTAPVAGTGTQERPFNSLEQFRQTEIASGATIHFKAGTNCAASDTPFWGYGTKDAPTTVTTYGGGEAAHIGGRALDEELSALAAQGWVFDLPEVVDPLEPQLALSLGAVEAGKPVEVSLTGFAPDEEIRIELHSDPVLLGTVAADGDGSATFTGTIPAGTPAGGHTVVAIQGSTSVSTPVTVTAAAVEPPVTEPSPSTPPPTTGGTDPGTDPGTIAPGGTTPGGSAGGAGAGLNANGGADGGLAATGANVLAGSIAASLLMILGLGVLVAARRRRRHG